jgi:hypothetical protein
MDSKTEARVWALIQMLRPHPLRYISKKTHDMRNTLCSNAVDPRVRRWLLGRGYASEQRNCEGQDIMSITEAGKALAKEWGLEQ